MYLKKYFKKVIPAGLQKGTLRLDEVAEWTEILTLHQTRAAAMLVMDIRRWLLTPYEGKALHLPVCVPHIASRIGVEPETVVRALDALTMTRFIAPATFLRYFNVREDMMPFWILPRTRDLVPGAITAGEDAVLTSGKIALATSWTGLTIMEHLRAQVLNGGTLPAGLNQFRAQFLSDVYGSGVLVRLRPLDIAEELGERIDKVLGTVDALVGSGFMAPAMLCNRGNLAHDTQQFWLFHKPLLPDHPFGASALIAR